MRNVLLWIAGASKVESGSEEANRYAALGAMILTVAAISATTMSIALRTWVDHPWVVAGGSVGFGLVILTVERTLAISLKGKIPASDEKLSIGEYLSIGVSVLWRLCVAAVLGVIVSEPLMTEIFSGPISDQLQDKRSAELTEVRVPFRNKLDSLRSVREQVERRTGEVLSTQRARLRDLRALLTAENNGVVIERRGLKTSTVPGYGPKAERFDSLATATNEEVTKLQQRREQRLTGLDSRIDSVSAEMSSAVQERREEFEAGLLNQLLALQAASEKEPFLYRAHWLLWAAFVLLDTFPLLYKLGIGGGPLDQKTRQQEEKYARELGIERHAEEATMGARKEAEAALNRTQIGYKKKRAELEEEVNQFQWKLRTVTGELQDTLTLSQKLLTWIDEEGPPRPQKARRIVLEQTDEILDQLLGYSGASPSGEEEGREDADGPEGDAAPDVSGDGVPARGP